MGVLQPLSGGLASILGIGTPIGSGPRLAEGPEQPLPAFFAIWGVIFAAYLLFAILTLIKREPWMLQVGVPLAVAGAANVVWMVCAQFIVSQVLDFILLFPIAGAAWFAAARFDRIRGMGGSPGKLCADAATGLLSGWISVAVAISVPLTIRNFTTLGPTDLPWQMLWIVLGFAAFCAWVFARYVSRSLWFFAALSWGLIGIIANNLTVMDMGWLAIMTGVSGILILSLRLFRGADGTTIPA